MNKSVPQSTRILSLDVFRGLTIVAMILVNSQGNQYPYPILEHAAWNGCTLADTVFPSFLFIVGVTCVVSLQKQIRLHNRKTLYRAIATRSLILFALGVILNVFPKMIDWEHLRFYGILQRIAVCYLITSIIYCNTRVRTQIMIFLGIVWGYWFLLTQIPVPDLSVTSLSKEGNWVAYVDSMLFSPNHLLERTFDPEGLLSTLPSVATTLFGALIGSLLISADSNQKKLCFMLGIGIVFLVTGWCWNYSFPINKSLWTSSFVLWTGGYAVVMFALCFLLIDILGVKAWTRPFTVFGVNALFAFIVHIVFLKLQYLIRIPLLSGAPGPLKYYITEYWFAAYSPHNAALLYSLIFLLFNYLIVLYLYRRSIYIRI